MSDFLKKENCNKTHCKSCIFHPDRSKRINLSAERIVEINIYLRTFQSSHVCHVTNKTCYGGLEVQAQTAFAVGVTKSPDVDEFLNEAEKRLNFNK